MPDNRKLLPVRPKETIMKLLLSIAAALLTSISMASAQVADTIYTNARVYTVNPAQPWAEAVAIDDGALIAVGSAKDASKFAGKDKPTSCSPSRRPRIRRRSPPRSVDLPRSSPTSS
jgi:hypothetical protein